MCGRAVLSIADKYGLPLHLTVYVLTTVAILFLLFEQSQLAARVGAQPMDFGGILVQQVASAVLLLLLLATYGQIKNRPLYVLSAVLFAGYSVTRLASAFSQTLGLVPALENMGVPISEYQGTFYFLALAAAILYLLAILSLRRSYGQLKMKQLEYRRVS